MKLENLDDEIMVVCAMRYCLGRETYVVSSCCDFIKRVWPQIKDGQRGVIVRDILEAFEEGNVGANCDADCWRELVRWCYSKFDERMKNWLHQALAHRKDALDALNYDEIGRTVYLKGERIGGKITAYSDAHGLMYYVKFWTPDKDGWYEPCQLSDTPEDNTEKTCKRCEITPNGCIC